MEWRNLYQEKQTTAENAACLIQSRDRVVVGHACGSPEYLLDAMTARKTHYEAVEIVHMIPMGKAEYCLPENARYFRHHSLFAGSATREALASGRADYTPCFFHEIPSLFREKILPVDVCLITVSPPDNEGFVSLGVSVDYTREAVFSAKTVIAEETPAMPFTCGKSRIPLSRIDVMVRSGRRLPELAPSSTGDVEKAIGTHVSKLIADGDCLQLGIGAIPEAVLSFLSDKKDLGVHSEMISDGVMNLVEAGVITGKRKNIHPEKIIITFAMGSKKFYAWLHNNPVVEMHPVDYTNAPEIIGQNKGMVSINSTISVDLLGQVASDMMGPRQFSGVGGQVDFVRGCRLSTGGKSIIALPAAAARGTVSRIVSTLEQGQAVTTSRNDVDYVVTEYGIAPLRGKTVKARAEALIAIASPAFRTVLRKQFDLLYFQ